MISAMQLALDAEEIAKRQRKQAALLDLLRPGLRGIEAHFARETVPKTDWDDICRRLDMHLIVWLPDHLDDFKQTWRSAMIEFMRRETLDPDCYVPLVL